MKKYLLFLAIPFTLFAETCEELKSQAISNITSSESLITDNSRYIQITYNNITALCYTLDVLDQRTSGDPYVNTARGQVSAISNGVYLVAQNENTISNYLSTTRTLLSSIDCSCDESGTCPCDFSEIIQLLTSISSSTSDAYIELQSHGVFLSQIDDSLTDLYSLLEQGINDVTNVLIDISNDFGNLSTNLFNQYLSRMTYAIESNARFAYINGSSNYKNPSSMRSTSLGYNGVTNFRPFYDPITYGYIPAIYTGIRLNSLFSSSINNLLYDQNYFYLPSISNALVDVHRDQTNYFSFFRGEIGVNGVLEDWTNEESDGTYHDFLTNHYINVVRGGSLSGNASSKTNWFSRIETLLASLVFLDSANTNAYDSASQSVSNEINSVKDRFNSTLDGVSSAPSTQMELASDIEKSMYESLHSFSQAFSSASLPSSVRLIYVYKTSGSRSLSLSPDTVDVTVPVEGKLMDFVEIIRSATTLCWVFFGLWFMFKFSVWTVKKIYMLIRYIIDFFNMVAGGK